MKRYGIIGAGISGLCLATRIFSQSQKLGKAVFVQIYQSSSNIGGRVLTKDIKANSQITSFDLGANLIDFQTEETQKYWNNFMVQNTKGGLQILKKPFLLYENGDLKKGDYEKNRYFYKSGFGGLVKELASNLKSSNINIFCSHKVLSLNYKDQQIRLRIKNNFQDHQFEERFDKVYFTCPPPNTSIILRNSLEFCQQKMKKQLISLLQQCESIKYTKQISIGFKTKTNDHSFSCILFKNHPVLSFICSHREKYQQNTFVAQISEQFSQEYFQQSEQVIGKRVYESLPKEIQQMTEPGPLYIHRWPVSLLKKGKKIVCNEEILKIGMVGDCLMGKSRVSGAIFSTSPQLCKL